MIWVLAGILGAASLVAPSAQNAAPPATGLIHAPTVLQYLSAYPKPALDSKLSGKVNLHCAVEVDGALSRCVAAEETPAGKGFGAASVTLAPFFKLGPGPFQPGDVIDIPLTWTPTGFAPAEPPPPSRADPVFDPSPGSTAANPPVSLRWLSEPDGYSIHYPERARRMDKSGQVLMRCKVKTDGYLSACVITSEKPLGFDFGAAALSMAPLYQVGRRDNEPLPDGRTVTIPIGFALN
jgi:TonB family protein